MSVKQARKSAVEKTVNQIKQILDDNESVENLEEAKSILMRLCENKALFPHDDFPIPADGIDCTYLIHQEPDSRYALYVNSSLPGQTSEPHDHGDSWAIVAAIEGEETHHLYVSNEHDGSDLREVAELVVKPGNAVSMLRDGIHSIEANGEQPLLHLHLYGRSFDTQLERRQFDPATKTVRRFVLDDVGFVADAR